MKIDRLVLGAFQTNCYVLRANETAKNCLIIDPGLEPESLLRFLHDNNLNPQAIILTHGHADHTAGVGPLRDNFSAIKLYIHELDDDMLTGATNNLSELADRQYRTEHADSFLNDADELQLAQICFQVLHTPGHTPGGVCLYCKDDHLVFVGDTLFADSVGRTDLTGGDFNTLISSVKEKLFTLTDDTVVYPGHGPATTIGREKAYNPFLK